MAKSLNDVLLELKGNVKKYYTPKKAEGYVKRITRIEAQYKGLKVAERHQDTYDSLCKRGVELLKATNLKDEDKLKYFLRYCDAARYDFKDQIEPLTWIIRGFMVTTMFFYLITPQYFGYILPLIMVVPVFIGLRGMKKRSLNGLITGCAIVPLAMMVGTLHLKNIMMAANTNYALYATEQAARYNLSIEVANGLLTTMNIITLIMMASAAITAYLGIRHNKMFI